MYLETLKGKVFFSFLFVVLGYTCLHSQLFIDGYVHHWIMATRGSAYLIGLVRGFAGAYGVLRERPPVMVNGRKSLFLGDTLYIYNVCLRVLKAKYMKNSQRKMACGIGLSLVFLQKRPSKKG